MRLETITRELYPYDELTPKAQATARDWYRELLQGDPDLLDTAVEGLAETLTALGISKAEIAYSGFASQGDGASFTGTWEYDAAKLAAVRADYATDTDLHAIIDRLAALGARLTGTGAATVLADVVRDRRERYAHERTVDVTVTAYRDGDETDVPTDTADEIAGALRELMRWIYRTLEAEYDYQQSDDAIADAITANDHEFLKDGRRAPRCQ